MALLGQSINPALFVQDYSGFTKAAAIQAQGMQNLGQQIQDVAKDYATNKKEESKLNAIAKVGKTQLESALNLYGDKIPGLREKLAPTIAAFADPNRSAVEKATLAQVAGDELNNYLNFSLKQQELGVNERIRQTAALATAARDRATEAYRAAQLKAKDETSYKESTITQDINGETYTKNVLLDPSTGSRYDPDTMIRIGDTVKYMSGQSGWEGGQAPTTTQNVSFNSSNLSQNLKPLSSAFEDAGKAYNVPPTLLAAIAELETGNGTSSAFINKKNAMGVSDKTGPISFGSPVESIYKMASLLGQGINEGTGPYAGVKSIQDIANIYAPIGAENDPNGTNSSWASGVTANIQKLSKQPTQVAPETTASNSTQTTPLEPVPRGARKKSSTEVTTIDPTTGKVTITRGGSEPNKTAVAAAAQKKQTTEGMAQFNDLAANLIPQLEKQSSGVISAIGRAASAYIPTSESQAIQDDLGTVKNYLSRDYINTLRASSPTGSAGGQITENEWPRYERQYGVLDISRDPRKNIENLQKIAFYQFNSIHGTPSERSELLKNGKITPEQNAQVEQMYVDMRQRLHFPDSGIKGVAGSELKASMPKSNLSPTVLEKAKAMGL
jgi:hypothetical protein